MQKKKANEREDDIVAWKALFVFNFTLLHFSRSGCLHLYYVLHAPSMDEELLFFEKHVF